MFFGSDEEIINKAISALKNNEAVAIPTETVYGLAANALSEEAVSKIFRAKGRPADNPLIVHISNINNLEKIAVPDERVYKLAEKFWPGPLTIIIPKKEIIPGIVSAGLDTVAVRMPSNKTALEIIERSGLYLAAPSANLSGSPSPTRASHVYDDYSGKKDDNGNDLIAGIVDGGECRCGVESTVVSLAGDIPVILRPGFITPKQIEDVLSAVTVSSAVLNSVPKGEKALSPGMLHKHYAPKAETEGVSGSAENASAYINSFADRSIRQAIMCFDGEEEKYSRSFFVMPYGSIESPEKMAHNIFDYLRVLDKENVRKIFIRMFLDDGIALAVYNRLIRACEFRITDADKKPLVIGITGPSGAGKGTVCVKLEQKGFFHIDTDKIARDIVPESLPELKREFGIEIINEDNSLNRKKLAEIAFASPEKTEKLNMITHRKIMEKVKQIAGLKAAERKSVLVDGAALFEANAQEICDAIIGITSDYSKRIDRVTKRDGITAEAAAQRFAQQKSLDFLKINCDFLVDNTDDKKIDENVDQIIRFINNHFEK